MVFGIEIGAKPMDYSAMGNGAKEDREKWRRIALSSARPVSTRRGPKRCRCSSPVAALVSLGSMVGHFLDHRRQGGKRVNRTLQPCRHARVYYLRLRNTRALASSPACFSRTILARLVGNRGLLSSLPHRLATSCDGYLHRGIHDGTDADPRSVIQTPSSLGPLGRLEHFQKGFGQPWACGVCSAREKQRKGKGKERRSLGWGLGK